MQVPRKTPFKSLRPLPALFLLFCTAGTAWAQGDSLSAARQTQSEIDRAGRLSQARIDELSEEARRMLAEYRSARDRAAGLEQYNKQLAAMVESQDEEIASLGEQLADIDTTQQEFVPLMQEMVATLDEFVTRDTPFLPEERRQRVRDLKSMMDRADVTTAEKFRKVMAAYQAEMDYGRTIETYRDELEIDGEARTVRLLRVGRVALLYQTLDGRATGRWSPEAGDWQRVDDYRSAVEKGLSIASEQAPPDLLRLPVTAPEDK